MLVTILSWVYITKIILYYLYTSLIKMILYLKYFQLYKDISKKLYCNSLVLLNKVMKIHIIKNLAPQVKP